MDMIQNKVFFSCVLSSILVVLSFESHAFSSVAVVKGHAQKSFYSSFNYDTQREANKNAIAGCKIEAKKNGIESLANSCVVVEESNIPGYGAVSCGDENCAWALGYYDVKEAMDAAYFTCSESYTNCNEKGIKNWEDNKGFKKVNAPVPTQTVSQSLKM
jgi:hypothetical protein